MYSDSSNPTSGYEPQRTERKDPKRYLQAHVHSSVIGNSQNMEETQMTISKRMDKPNKMSTQKERLFSLKRKFWYMPQHGWTIEGLMLSKINQKQKDKYWKDSTSIGDLQYSSSRGQKVD